MAGKPHPPAASRASLTTAIAQRGSANAPGRGLPPRALGAPGFPEAGIMLALGAPLNPRSERAGEAANRSFKWLNPIRKRPLGVRG